MTCRTSSGSVIAVDGGLGRLVGVERALVVGVGPGVQLAAGQVEVELLQLLAQRGRVLERELAHRGQLGLLALQLARLGRRWVTTTTATIAAITSKNTTPSMTPAYVGDPAPYAVGCNR